jgi:ATP/maltotriose-dependent transcriptional regulator MalT
MASPFIETKFHIPPTRPGHIPRPRLVDKIVKRLYRKLTVISAPAGFGKSSLVSELIKSHCLNEKAFETTPENIGVAWVALDEGENTPGAFLTVIITALQRTLAPTQDFASDLRFIHPEAVEFMARETGKRLPEEVISVLEERTEGWIAGLQMAALSLHRTDDSTAFISSFSGSHRLVLDYLIEEVLEHQADETENFLLRTSVLRRMSGPLCDVLMESKPGAGALYFGARLLGRRASPMRSQSQHMRQVRCLNFSSESGCSLKG